MWRVKLIIAAILLSAAFSAALAQNINPIMDFLGVTDEEDLNPYDVERLEDLMAHPLEINLSGASALEESGLFTPYQTASLKDYRSRHGDICSYFELAAVDGFTPGFVAKLKPFISLEGGRLAGLQSRKRIHNELSLRTSVKPSAPVTYGLKYRLEAGGFMTGGIAVSRTASASGLTPDTHSGHLAFRFKKGGKILIGDFNARFGQGLALWNGMSFSGLTSSSTFMKRPSGISPSSSFTGSFAFRGIAGDFYAGRTKISLLTSVDLTEKGISALPAVNLTHFFRSGQIAMTHYADFAFTSGTTRIPDMKTSADAAFCIKGTDIFAEVSYDWVTSSTAALSGTSFNINEDMRMSAMLRYYPSLYSSARSSAARSTTKCTNEYALSLAADFSAGGHIKLNGSEGFGSSVRRHLGKASIDCAYFPAPKSEDSPKSLQTKIQAEWTSMLSGACRLSLRISERMRTWGEPFRTDIRTDFSFLSEHFTANVRLNAVHCRETALLGYAEGGYRSGILSSYLRLGLFRVDNWDDRIYAYERDAPGSFNVPAYYGRGIWAALTVNWRFIRWGRMYIRGAMTSYPFMAEKKPGRAELKFQFVFTF